MCFIFLFHLVLERRQQAVGNEKQLVHSTSFDVRTSPIVLCMSMGLQGLLENGLLLLYSARHSATEKQYLASFWYSIVR